MSLAVFEKVRRRELTPAEGGEALIAERKALANQPGMIRRGFLKAVVWLYVMLARIRQAGKGVI